MTTRRTRGQDHKASNQEPVAPCRHAGLVALSAYGATTTLLSLIVVELVGDAASHVAGRRTITGVILQFVAFIVIIAAAGFHGDTIIERCRRFLVRRMR